MKLYNVIYTIKIYRFIRCRTSGMVVWGPSPQENKDLAGDSYFFFFNHQKAYIKWRNIYSRKSSISQEPSLAFEPQFAPLPYSPKFSVVEALLQVGAAKKMNSLPAMQTLNQLFQIRSRTKKIKESMRTMSPQIREYH